MARWRCGGRDGCGTVYALKLFRCPRCHGTRFEEDNSMAKITRHGGPTNAAAGEGEPGYMPPPAVPAPEPPAELVAEPGPEVIDFPAEESAEAPVEDQPEEAAEAASDSTSTGRRRNRRGSGGESA